MDATERVAEALSMDRPYTFPSKAMARSVAQVAIAAMGPQLTPEQAELALELVNRATHFNPPPYRPKDLGPFNELRWALHLIAERGGTDG